MASPLRWFRKHSFFFIVVFGVFLMGIFGLGSVISGLNPSSMGRSAQAENKTLAEWSGGELKQTDVMSLRQRHFASLRLLQNIYKYAVEQNGGNNFPVAVEEIMPIARPGENISVEQMDERIMNRYLFAKRAEQEGFVVDDNMVYEYVAQYGGDTLLSKNMLKQLNRQVNQQLPMTAVIRHLQIELLWQQMESMTDGGLAFDPAVAPSNPRRLASLTAISPTEALELYKQSSQKIECVVLPFPIEEYVSNITEKPSSSEIEKLYEEGKYDYPVYNFDTPGFKQLKKTKVQYFKAEMKTFLDNEIAKLTDEEIQTEYNRLVEAEDPTVMKEVPIDGEKADEGDAAGGDTSDSSTEDPAPTPNAEESATESAEPSDEDPSSEGGAQEPVQTEETPAQPEEESSNSGGYTSIGFQEEAPQETAQAVVEKVSEQTEEASTPDQETTPTENAESAEMAEQSVEQSNTPKETAPAENTGEATPDQNNDAIQDPVIEDEPKTKMVAKPLTEVIEQIKRQMKIQDARKARDKALEAVEKVVTFYQRDLSTYERDESSGKEDLVKPEVPDFKKLADDNGIQFHETELIDETEIGDVEIGQIIDIAIGPGGRAQQINVGQQIFADFDNLPEFQVLTANDFVRNSKFMYWLADKESQKVPTLEEAEESIIEYWKKNKAVELATEDAVKLMDEINSKENVLLNELKPEKSKLTGQFSWFSSFGRFAYGAPEGVTNPGETFMKEAFSLGKQMAGVATNETRDTVYLVQNITPEESTTTEIADDYLEKNFFMTKQVPREVVSAKAQYRQLMIEDWIRNFRETMDVKIVGQ